ncbi:MAG: cytochrome C [Mariprofundaceae bacterium]|nr:cytochrome C [Mariprofundaceae bacterium]
MKRKCIIAAGLFILATPALAADVSMDHTAMHQQMMDMQHGSAMPVEDSRISLKLPPAMRQNQLAMMREHLKAVDAIVMNIAEGKFDEASNIAHDKLGLTPKMKKMCAMYGNDQFKDLGFAFHDSADELGEVLKTKDIKRSLKALHKTMDKCISCHATFRQ